MNCKTTFHPVLFLCILSLSSFAFVAVPPASANEWTRFRGTGGAGISDATTVPVEFSEKDYNWKIDLHGIGRSSPVVWGDNIFLTVVPHDKPHTRRLLCLSAKDGGTVWSVDEDFDEFHQHGLNRFASSTPAVDADHVYLYWVSGDRVVVRAVDHEGKPVWKREFESFEAEHGHASSPIVVNDVVIIANDQIGEDKAFIMGLDRKDGATLWKHPRTNGKANYSTPAVIPSQDTASGKQVVFVSQGHGLAGVDPEAGDILWEFGGNFDHRSCGGAVFAGGIVFATVGSGSGGKDSAAVRPVATKGGKETEAVYRFSSHIPYVPTPVAYEGRFYFWGDAGVIHCVEADSGKTVYEERVEGKGGYYSSPVCVNGKIYGFSREGDSVVVATGTSKLEVLARNTIGGEINATPAVAGGVMYIRTDTHLISLGGAGAR